MQHINTLLAASLVLTAPLNALAIEWSPIINKPDYEILVDIDSYKAIQDKPMMTTKTIFKAPQNHISPAKSIQYISRIEATQFNCRKPQYKPLSLKLYDAKKRLLLTEQQTDEFQPITQDSDLFSIGQLTCQVHQMIAGQ